VHCTTPFSDSGAKPQQGTYCLVDDTGYRKLPREDIRHPKPEWRRSFYHDRKWPEPEATLAAGGVRCLGSTCRGSVGGNPPLVTRLGHAARKDGAAQQRVVDSRKGTYHSARRHMALGNPAQSLRNFPPKQGWNSDSLLFQNTLSRFAS
jgi:hypothetical protein